MHNPTTGSGQDTAEFSPGKRLRWVERRHRSTTRRLAHAERERERANARVVELEAELAELAVRLEDLA